MDVKIKDIFQDAALLIEFKELCDLDSMTEKELAWILFACAASIRLQLVESPTDIEDTKVASILSRMSTSTLVSLAYSAVTRLDAL